jgi:cysteine desulfurase / selenocysteine lyase
MARTARSELVDLPEGRSYLNTAAEGLPVREADEALARALSAKRDGSRGRETLYAGEAACRESAGCLVGVDAREVALVPDVSTGITRFVEAFPWNRGDEVLLNDLEFPSNVTPWLAARDRHGIRVRVVPTRAGVLQADDLAAAVTDRTRVVTLSHVSFQTGGRADLERIARAVRESGATLCVDATQALGVVPLPADCWDVVWSSGYKWLLGVHGVAIMALRQRTLELLRSGAPGWRSLADPFAPDRFERLEWHTDARRFHAGMPAFGAIFVLEAAIRALRAAGVEAIEAHVSTLGSQLLEGLDALGIQTLTPADPRRRAGIVAFETAVFASVGAALDAAGVDVWARDGRVRISFHHYTTPRDIDRCLDVLATLAPL